MISGRGAARLARLTGGQEVESSNLFAPTIYKGSIHKELGELSRVF